MKSMAAPFDLSNEPQAAFFRAVQSIFVCGALTLAAVLSLPESSLADEGGVSFWVPGFFGSLAAVPQQPGWSVTNIYYQTDVSGGSSVALAKEFEIGKIPVGLTANLNASVAPGILALSSRLTCSQRPYWAAKRRSAWWRHTVHRAPL
jgi:hypothetical protein